MGGKRLTILLGSVLILMVCILLGIKLGPVSIPFRETFKVIVNESFCGNYFESVSKVSTINIIWKIRLPRVLLACIVGANLSLAGVGVQTLTNNPLANPFLMGVSSGASSGAVFVMLFGSHIQLGAWSIVVGAVVGALIAVSIVLVLVRLKGIYSSVYLVLTGFAVSSLFGALTSLMIFGAKDTHAVRSALFWMTGNFSGAKWDYIVLTLPMLLIGWIFYSFSHRELDAMVLGEEHASILGVNTVLFRRMLIITSTLMTAVAVSVSGVIGFVGLIIPHVVRMIVGAKHKHVIPLVVIMGASFMVLADLLSRMIFNPEEVPIGIVTSLFGAPFFIWLMYRSSYRFGG